MSNPTLTPMMRQYLEIKSRHQDAVLFFRLGDFYEMFFEDAVRASEILEIALTSRNKNEGDSVPLCGIPYHAASGYIRRLIGEGLKVAICEQIEDPKLAKGIVKREVTRVITPGLFLEEDAEPHRNHYLAAFVEDQGVSWVAWLDMATGAVFQSKVENRSELAAFLGKLRASELLVSEALREDKFLEKIKLQSPKLAITFLASQKEALETEKFSESLLASLKALSENQARAVVEGLLQYVATTQKSLLSHLRPVQVLQTRHFLGIDERTFRHLELTQNSRGEGRRGTLFQVLDQTVTGMGARKLLHWIHYPLLDLEAITERQDAIAELLETPELLRGIQQDLKPVKDVERMLGRLALETVHGRDLQTLAASLEHGQALLEAIRPKLKREFFRKQLEDVPDLRDLAATLRGQLKEELPLGVRDGGLIAAGVNAELDELRAISHDGKSVIAAMETAERQRTGITSLKVRFNRVFGYYIEIPNTRREAVPEDYLRKQTLANAERYITPQLKEYEGKVLGAEERIKNLEYELFCELRKKCRERIEEIRAFSEILAQVDAIASLACVSRERRYARPVFTEEMELCLVDCRHPVLEQQGSSERFIPNDVKMSAEERLFLITGPNMAGKSTLMRQVALVVLMAQMGCYVPASEARLSIVDQIFARIGASDDLSQGQSTFMVEMLETSHILKHATKRSLIILDEIGRGTSTYDGMSLAWAIAEQVSKQVGCLALFATHYHELTELAAPDSGIVNYQIAVKEWNGSILFLRKLLPGAASRSYGIEVARLAGLPDPVLKRASEVLQELESMEGKALNPLRSEASREQMDLFASGREEPALRELKNLQPEQLSPLEALNFLFKIKSLLP